MSLQNITWSEKVLNDVLTTRLNQHEAACYHSGESVELTALSEIQRRFDRDKSGSSVIEDHFDDPHDFKRMASWIVLVMALRELREFGYVGYVPDEEDVTSIYDTIRDLERYAIGTIGIDDIQEPGGHLPFMAYAKWYVMMCSPEGP